MPRTRLTEKRLRHQHDLFCRLQKLPEVFDLLRIPPHKFKALTESPQYHSFTIPKKSGGERHIENPKYELKKIQERLNRYLQAVYYFEKTPLAYGFILNPNDTQDRRDILENARRHLGKPYLLNLDLKDFFHRLEVPQIWKVFGRKPMRFQREAVEGLTRLVTFRGRLPMGAPTSPVLSNLATRKLDTALFRWGETNDCTLTRYADDISVSSEQPITAEKQKVLLELITERGFLVNTEKTKYFESDDLKEVTGLVLQGENIQLPETFIPELEKEIQQLQDVILVQHQQGKLNTNWVNSFKKHLRGKITFASYVLGRDHPKIASLNAAFEEASYPPPEEFGSYSWRQFHYQV